MLFQNGVHELVPRAPRAARARHLLQPAAAYLWQKRSVHWMHGRPHLRVACLQTAGSSTHRKRPCGSLPPLRQSTHCPLPHNSYGTYPVPRRARLARPEPVQECMQCCQCTQRPLTWRPASAPEWAVCGRGTWDSCTPPASSAPGPGATARPARPNAGTHLLRLPLTWQLLLR